MKRLISFLVLALLLVGCAAQRAVQVGNVTIRNRTGEVTAYYQRVQILNQVGSNEAVTNITFVTREGEKHYVEDGLITVDGVEYIQERRSSTYVVVESYPYWYYRSPYIVTYPYRSYYHPYYNRRPAPRPAPQSRPRTSQQGGRPRR